MSESVFVSSVIGNFEAVRLAAREAIESVGMRPVMAEMAGARPQSPRQALLGDVASADVFLLLLGAHYGEPGESGLSPTEEEFDEARARNRPIVVLRQDVEMEPRQRAFLERAAGGWEEGALWDRFTDERDVGMKIVKALTNARRVGDTRELSPQAQQRALEMAGDDGGAWNGYGSQARIALVPLTDALLLDDLTLDDASLPDRLSELARATSLVSQTAGIDARVQHGGVTLAAGRDQSGPEASLSIGEAGEVLVEASVAGEDQHFGSSRIDPEKLARLFARGARYASGVWRQIDPRGQVQQVAVAVGIPNASMKVYGRPKAPSNTLSMGGATRLPDTIVVPEPPFVVRRVDVEGEDLHKRLLASVRRVFADAGAIEEGS